MRLSFFLSLKPKFRFPSESVVVPSSNIRSHGNPPPLPMRNGNMTAVERTLGEKSSMIPDATSSLSSPISVASETAWNTLDVGRQEGRDRWQADSHRCGGHWAWPASWHNKGLLARNPVFIFSPGCRPP